MVQVRRDPVTIVCVYNDADVLEGCLRRSVQTLRPTAPETELIAVDNRAHQYPTAGAALNYGARQARNPVVVFAHQDVIVHSLVALEAAAGLLGASPHVGLVGACGIDSMGVVRGRIRDRVVLIGERSPGLTPVDSLDEVLFMARKADLDREPLSEHPQLAWHAYAVEYGLRSKAVGRAVCVADIPITHNSLTVNLAKLTEAHAQVAASFPSLMPIRTTCGVLPPRGESGLIARALRPHRWRYRWFRESWALHAGARRSQPASVALSDIRLDVDALLEAAPGLLVVNVDDGRFGAGADTDVETTRAGIPLTLTSRARAQVLAELTSHDPRTSILITNLDLADLADAHGALRAATLGYATDLGFWALLGPVTTVTPPTWSEPRARPVRALSFR